MYVCMYVYMYVCTCVTIVSVRVCVCARARVCCDCDCVCMGALGFDCVNANGLSSLCPPIRGIPQTAQSEYNYKDIFENKPQSEANEKMNDQVLN